MASLFKKILVPHDFSRSADAALAIAVDLAVTHGGTLQLIHVMSPVRPIHGRALPPPVLDVTAAEERLAALAKRAAAGKRVRQVRTRVVIGAPVGCILEAAAKADAIVMGTLGRTGLPHLLIGSVAERVVRHAPVPVMTVRAAGRRRH